MIDRPSVCPLSDVDLVLEVFNRLDPHLESRNGSLVLAVARLLVPLACLHPSLRPSLAARLGPVLARHQRTARRELQADLLQFMLGLEQEYIKAGGYCVK